MHDTSIWGVVVIQVACETARTEIWRALYGAMSFQEPVGKYVIAVNDDIDPNNLDAVFWAMSYRANLAEDCELIKHRPLGHGPKTGAAEDATLAIDATLKANMAPVALPKREYMEHASVVESWGYCPEAQPPGTAGAGRLAGTDSLLNRCRRLDRHRRTLQPAAADGSSRIPMCASAGGLDIFGVLP